MKKNQTSTSPFFFNAALLHGLPGAERAALLKRLERPVGVARLLGRRLGAHAGRSIARRTIFLDAVQKQSVRKARKNQTNSGMVRQAKLSALILKRRRTLETQGNSTIVRDVRVFP